MEDLLSHPLVLIPNRLRQDVARSGRRLRNPKPGLHVAGRGGVAVVARPTVVVQRLGVRWLRPRSRLVGGAGLPIKFAEVSQNDRSKYQMHTMSDQNVEVLCRHRRSTFY